MEDKTDPKAWVATSLVTSVAMLETEYPLVIGLGRVTGLERAAKTEAMEKMVLLDDAGLRPSMECPLPMLETKSQPPAHLAKMAEVAKMEGYYSQRM
jgi:hypothetical protein